MSASLTITRLSGFDRNKKLTFDGSKVTLGSDAGCDVRFDPTWDRTVSARHAELVWEGDTWWVVDASKDGTWLDGQTVKKAKVPGGTVLELGKGGPKIRLEWDAPVAPAPAPAPAAAPVAGPATDAPPPLPPTAPVASMPAPAPAAPPAARPATAGAAKASSGPMVAVIILLVVLLAGAGGAAWWFFGRGGDVEQGLMHVAQDKAGAVGLVVGVHPDMGDGQPQGIATAWAVEPRLFATNSHVVESVDAVLEAGGSAFIVINRSGEQRLRITGTRMHPRYGKPHTGFEGQEAAVPAFDVGLLMTETDAPEVFEIADQDELGTVDSGYRIGYLGFPMEGMAGGGASVRNPVATMQSGIVTAATDFWLGKAEYSQRLLIQHNLGAAGGASGSPIFNAEGEVVGILSAGNISGVLQNGESIARVPSGVMVNFAQRIDMLRDIWSGYPAK